MKRIFYNPEDSRTYERFRMPGSSFHSDKYRMMLRSVPKDKNHKVLEIGAGTGIYTRFLVRDFKHVVATDIDEGMCAQAKRLIPEADVQQADACKLPFPDNSFDGVFGVGILHHISNRLAMFREVARVLKPGGWFAFCEPNALNPFTRFVQFYFREAALTCRGMKRDAQNAGLTVTDKREIMLRSPRITSVTDHIPGWRLIERAAGALHLGVSAYVTGRK